MVAKRALVIDTEATGSQVAALLARHGLTVECLVDGEQAWRRFVALAPQLVVCSERSAGLSGMQLCQQIRSMGSRARVVLLFSAPLSPAAAQELCADVGCDAALSPPLHLEEVLALVRQWRLLPAGESAAGLASAESSTPALQPMVLPLPVPVPTPPPEPAPSPILPMAEYSPEVDTLADFTPPFVAADDRAVEAAPSQPVVEPSLPLVSAAPGGAAAVNVPRFGNLTDHPLPRLLYLLYAGRFYGVVDLQRQGVRRAIYVWAGMPVRIDSEQLSDTLGVMLLEEGTIDERQLEQAKEDVAARGVAFGAALVERHILSEHQVLEALRRQTERKLLGTFAWQDGTFVTREDTRFAEDTVLSEVAPLPVIWRGVRAHIGVGPLMQFFSRLRQRYVVATELFSIQWPALQGAIGDLQLLPVLDGRHTFEAALISDAGRTVELAQGLYVLLVTDMIRAAEEAGSPAHCPSPPPEARPVEYLQLAGASERLAARYLQLKNRDPFALLELSPTAKEAAIEKAYLRVAAEVAQDAAAVGLSGEDLRRAHELHAALPALHQELLQPQRRAQWRQATSPRSGVRAELGDRRRQRLLAEQAYREARELIGSAPRQARQKAEEAIALCPEEPAYLVVLAQAVLAGGVEPGEPAVELAHQWLEKARRLDPAHLLANVELGRLLLNQGQNTAARAALERVLQRAPQHAVASALLAQLPSA